MAEEIIPFSRTLGAFAKLPKATILASSRLPVRPFIGYAYSAGRVRFRLRFRESEPVGAKRVMQADSGSDSVSEDRNKNEEIIPVNRLTPTVCTDPPEPATTILLNKGHSLRQSAQRMSFV